MENKDVEFNPLLKKQAGQSGVDGHVYRRTSRIEIRVSPVEKAQIEALALGAGYNNLAQYLRETGLNPVSKNNLQNYNEQNKWLHEINRIGNAIDHISLRMQEGRGLDEEIFLYVLQIQEMVEQVWKAAMEAKARPTDTE
ncbi:hypothetical protein B0T49_21810 [Chromobacterium violaceum]|nr:hypothetical protein B0T49_21810 [Chromobacterium violaceum]OQS45841.1 hypothetical protein B0T48_17970 [Chromobacterium violaceum]